MRVSKLEKVAILLVLVPGTIVAIAALAYLNWACFKRPELLFMVVPMDGLMLLGIDHLIVHPKDYAPTFNTGLQIIKEEPKEKK